MFERVLLLEIIHCVQVMHITRCWNSPIKNSIPSGFGDELALELSEPTERDEEVGAEFPNLDVQGTGLTIQWQVRDDPIDPLSYYRWFVNFVKL